MNAKELAGVLNGIEYSATIHLDTSELMKQAGDAGLVVAYGFSDDLVVFEGAISDEVSAPGTVLLDRYGILPSFQSASQDEEDCRVYFERKLHARSIEPVWNANADGYAWTIKTDISHEVFAIMEDGVAFSRGIVFALSDLAPVACQGASCGATDGVSHSPECVAEAAETQGWADAPEAIKAREEAAAQGAPEAAPATGGPFKLTEDQLFGVIEDLARQVAAAENRTAEASMAILGLLIAAGGKVVVTAEHVQKMNLFGFSTNSSEDGQSCTFSLVPASPEPAAVQ